MSLGTVSGKMCKNKDMWSVEMLKSCGYMTDLEN